MDQIWKEKQNSDDVRFSTNLQYLGNLQKF